jgi:ribulose-bisphosphate carboxylase large chain
MERPGQYAALISFAGEIASGELTQLLNVLFGNVSIKRGIQLARIHPSDVIFDICPGPRFGTDGIRDAVGVHGRPLLFTALKPMGLSARNMAALAGRFVEGGVDIVKDDHGITNQAFAPFGERVALVAAAVREANERFGRASIYVPNVTAPAGQIVERARTAKDLGAGGLLVTPGLTGFDAMRQLRESGIELPIFAHPAFIGSYVTNADGIACDALFGSIMRIAGADATIFPNYGGRFPLSKDECMGIAHAGREEFGRFKPIFPCPAGGMELADVKEMIASYGSDLLLLVGGGIFNCGGDLASNCRRVMSEIEDGLKPGAEP